MFGIFGGHLEDGESPETGLFREILEGRAYKCDESSKNLRKMPINSR
jgi:hypothetical protein